LRCQSKRSDHGFPDGKASGRKANASIPGDSYFLGGKCGAPDYDGNLILPRWNDAATSARQDLASQQLAGEVNAVRKAIVYG
jgi:hypothetical protein